MRRLLALLAGLLFLATVAARDLEIHVIDVGQGDAVLVREPEGRTALYDGGRSPDPVLRRLAALGIDRLDLVVASHADADHIGGLVEVVRRYRPRYFLDNGLPHPTRTYARLLEAVAEAGSVYVEPAARTIRLGEAELRVLPPPGDPELGQNDNSVGLVLRYGAFGAALTGDAEASEFGWWAEHHPEALQEVQLYKSSHHGSENGDTPLAMSRFRPDVVVISVGDGNPYGHPSARARRLYEAVDARVLQTNLHGTVVARARRDGAFELTVERRAELPAIPDEAVVRRAAERAGTGDATIACVLYDPAGRGDGRERVVIRANEAIDLAGWSLGDEAGHRFALPARRLAPDATVEVPNDGRPVWNDDGDVATLRDAAGGVVDRLAYRGGGTRACR